MLERVWVTSVRIGYWIQVAHLVCQLLSARYPWASLSIVKTKRSKFDSRILSKVFPVLDNELCLIAHVLPLLQVRLCRNTETVCSPIIIFKFFFFFFFLIWLSALNKALEPGTCVYEFWLPLDLTIWHWSIHLHFDLVPYYLQPHLELPFNFTSVINGLFCFLATSCRICL